MMSEEEAEDNGVISVTPELDKPRGNKKRISTGKSSIKASPSLSDSDGKHLPHYLRASTGSCHEFCKYGRKHVFEGKKRLPVRSIFLGSSESTDNEHNQVKTSSIRRRKKKQDLKPKQKKVDLPNEFEAIKQKDPLLSPAIDIPSTAADGSCEELLSNSAVEHTPANMVEGSSEETVIIKLMITPGIASDEHPPPNLAPSDEAISIQLDTPPSTLENLAFAEGTPFAWASPEYTPCSCIEGSLEESVSIGLMTSSTTQETIRYDEHTPSNGAERSLKKLTTLELITSSSIQGNVTSAEHGFIDRIEGSSATSVRAKPKKIVLPVRKSITSARQTPYIHAEKSEESANMKLKSLSPVRRSISSAKNVKANRREESSKEQNQVKCVSSVDQKKKQLAMPKATPNSNSNRPRVIKKDKVDASGDPRISLSPAKKGNPSFGSQLIRKSLLSVKKAVSSGTPKIIKQKASSPPKGIYVSGKPTISLQSKKAVMKSISSMISSGLNDQKNMENKIVRNPVPSKTVSGVSSMKLKKFRNNTKPASPLKKQVKTANGEHDVEVVKEKILHVIEPKQFSISSGSKETFKVSRSKKPDDASKVDGKLMRARRTATLPSEDKPPSPHKLKFRIGKVVSLPTENNGPRRLRFRQLRAVNENHIELGTKSFRKRRGSIDADNNPPPSTEGPSVVLRHQDVQDKKDPQLGLLLNHVIEETASRLVQTRKSKVKALVGAFETVISLQERKVAPAL